MSLAAGGSWDWTNKTNTNWGEVTANNSQPDSTLYCNALSRRYCHCLFLTHVFVAFDIMITYIKYTYSRFVFDVMRVTEIC